MTVILIRADNGRVIGREWFCHCGNAAVTSYRSNDTTCGSCGQDYNGMGQRLAPRRQWSEG